MTEKGKVFLKTVEGCDFIARWDRTGYAIGYGNHFLCDNQPVPKGYTISSIEEADLIFECSLPGIERALKRGITEAVYNELNTNQQDALMSLVYNRGHLDYDSDLAIAVRNPNQRNDVEIITNGFALQINPTQKEDVKAALRKRRAREAAFYFGNPTQLPGVDNYDGSEVGKHNQKVYNPSYGIENMFYELSHSSDWEVVSFKHLPKPSNKWRYLFLDKSRPRVGDLLFAYHDYKLEGEHDHVAIYLGMHGGKQYVAEGVSISGDTIQGKDSDGVQIVPIELSRIGLSSDSITHFAHCKKSKIKQTTESDTYIPYVRRSNSSKYAYSPVVGEERMIYFDLYGFGNNGLRAPDDVKRTEVPNGTTIQEVQQKLIDLCNYVLDPLQKIALEEELGYIKINSPYRTPKENGKLSNAVSDSQHTFGEAADIILTNCTKGNNRACLLRLAQIVLELESQTEFEYDQMILEGIDRNQQPNKTVPGWIHISFKKGQNRTYASNKFKLSYTTDNGRDANNDIKLGPVTPITPSNVINQRPFG